LTEVVHEHHEDVMKHWLRVAATILMYTAPLHAQGEGWSVRSSPTLRNLYGVAYSDRDTWVAVGGGGTILRSSDGGLGWASVSSPVVDDLRGVSFRGRTGLAVGISGRVLRTTDGGSSWSTQSRPTTKNLYAVSMGDSVAVITGEEGTILVSTDAGMTWSQRTAGTASALFGVSVHGTTAVGVGGQATVVMSSNAAQGWGLTVLGPGQQLFFYGTSFASATTGWAVGSYTVTGSIIIKSTLSGFVWTPQSAPTTNTLTGVSFADIDTGTAVGFNGTIVHTTNGGTEWTGQQSPTRQSLNAVSFVDSRTGVAVGDSGTILRTGDGGLADVAVREPASAPSLLVLSQNYPNPFNPTTVINFRTAVVSDVRLTVYDLLGHEVAVLVNERKEPGSYEVKFDGAGLASGAYLYRLTAGELVQTLSLLLVK
jgi:photosystem II stability/assembly factor-like uncharacterized protein